jgi:membrane-bound ClpP family serine protease
MSLASILILLAIIYLVILIIEKLWLPLIITGLLAVAAGVIFLLGKFGIMFLKWASTGLASLTNGLMNKIPGAPAVSVSIPWWITAMLILASILFYVFMAVIPSRRREGYY